MNEEDIEQGSMLASRYGQYEEWRYLVESKILHIQCPIQDLMGISEQVEKEMLSVIGKNSPDPAEFYTTVKAVTELASSNTGVHQ